MTSSMIDPMRAVPPIPRAPVSPTGAPCTRCDLLEQRLARLASIALGAGIEADARGVADISPRVDPDDKAWPEGLSVRQYQVGALVAEGRSNAEIGEILFLGVNSVKTHLKALYRCLGVRNRTEAALWYVTMGQTDGAGGSPTAPAPQRLAQR